MAASDKLFLIGIGGTGMRCLESFVYMCAMGMFDGKEIDILTLDTDQANGNKARTEQLIQRYISIKDPEKKNDGGKPNKNTFFSAKLNLYQFYTDYSGEKTFRDLASSNKSEEENQILAELFLEESVQNFSLTHGYRAQTHLGSYLMYHGIVDAGREVAKGTNVKKPNEELGKFLEKLNLAAHDAKIFVFGSVFGGTGASSIPIIPKALNEALKAMGDGKKSVHKDAKYGATLLTEYFSFKPPSQEQKSNSANAIIADSNFFALNSQAAMQFYQDDPTVQNTYKKLYHVGWPETPENFSKDDNEKLTKTGGEEQKNKCHVAEFLCACAAHDFFNDDNLTNEKAIYLHKSVASQDGKLNFSYNDFVGDGEKGKEFAKRFIAFMTFMHFAQGKNSGGGAFSDNGIESFLVSLSKKQIFTYESIPKTYKDDLNEFMKSFGYNFDGNVLIPGWIYQIKGSVPGRFILEEHAYTKSEKDLEKIEIETFLGDKEHHWDRPKKIGISSVTNGDRWDWFVETLKEQELFAKPEQYCSETPEKFKAHIHNALIKMFNFS